MNKTKRNYDLNKNLYVLSVNDVCMIENVSYTRGYQILKSYDYFYINTKPYILASDYFGINPKYKSLQFSKIEESENIKIIKTLPMMLTVNDIKDIFNCGSRQAYEIMDIIPGTFKINSKRYISEKDFNEWLTTLPNQQLKIA